MQNTIEVVSRGRLYSLEVAHRDRPHECAEAGWYLLASINGGKCEIVHSMPTREQAIAEGVKQFRAIVEVA